MRWLQAVCSSREGSADAARSVSTGGPAGRFQHLRMLLRSYTHATGFAMHEFPPDSEPTWSILGSIHA